MKKKIDKYPCITKLNTLSTKLKNMVKILEKYPFLAERCRAWHTGVQIRKNIGPVVIGKLSLDKKDNLVITKTGYYNYNANMWHHSKSYKLPLSTLTAESILTACTDIGCEITAHEKIRILNELSD